MRPLVLDFADRSDEDLSGALGELAPALAGGAVAVAILDLGGRRSLLPGAMDALARTHRALRDTGGRCAVVVTPPLAAQLAVRHPDGLLLAATRRQALAALGTEPQPSAARSSRSA